MGKLKAGAWLLAALAAMFYVVAGAGLAWLLDPQPFSDWVRYWNSAGTLAGYERGGAGIWLLGLFKGLGLGPVASALALNLPAGLAMAWIAWRADGSASGAWAVLTALYLATLAPYAGLVQLDLVSATFVAAGLAVLAGAPAGGLSRGRQVGAVLLIAAGVSTKPQYALLAWALIALLAVPAWWLRRREAWAPGLLAVLLAGSVLGFSADLGLRHLGERSESVRTVSGVTLYAGLLVAEPGPTCGYWSPEAMQAARDDLGKPLLSAVGERLAARPASHWCEVLACKLPRILWPEPYALYWLTAAPSVQEFLAPLRADPRFEGRYQGAFVAERWVYDKLLVLAWAALAIAAVLAWRRGGRFAALLILAWPASFWAVHLVFEIQGRYFLGLYLLAPLVAALALAQADRRPKTPSFQGTNR